MNESICNETSLNNDRKTKLLELITVLVADEIDVDKLKSTLKKFLNSNGIELNSLIDTVKDNALIKSNKVLSDKIETKEIKVQPIDKEQLLRIIFHTINEKGNDCDLNFINTRLITDMSYLFSHTKFNGDNSKWNVSNVKYMSEMFRDSKFNGNISNWDISNVTYMNRIPYNSQFNSDISSWGASNNNYHIDMFENCPLENNP